MDGYKTTSATPLSREVLQMTDTPEVRAALKELYAMFNDKCDKAINREYDIDNKIAAIKKERREFGGGRWDRLNFDIKLDRAKAEKRKADNDGDAYSTAAYEIKTILARMDDDRQ